MKPIVEINTDYVDDNGVQHIDGYFSTADDAQGTVVAYFVKGEAYYTNPEYQFDELVKATVDGLKMEYNKTAQGKYKDVIDTVTVLQIPERAISYPIINRMNQDISFVDADTIIDENIYSATVFETVLENHKNDTLQLKDKYLSELNDLIELCKEYQYVMITKV